MGGAKDDVAWLEDGRGPVCEVREERAVVAEPLARLAAFVRSIVRVGGGGLLYGWQYASSLSSASPFI